MNWPHRDSNYIAPLVEPAKNEWTVIVPLVSAVISLTSAVLSFAGKFSRWGTVAVLFVAFVIAAPHGLRAIRWITRAIKRRKFVKREEEGLRELVRQFHPFTSDNYRHSIVCVVKSLCANNSNRIERFRATDFIEYWLRAFTNQLEFRTCKMYCFMTRCEEFVSIVQQFNSDYVLRAEKAIEHGEKVEQSYVEDLEHFREEYNAFLRTLETWVGRIAKDWNAVEHDGAAHGLPFRSHFERMKPIQLLAPLLTERSH